MSSTRTLYHVEACPCCEKVRLALALERLPWQSVAIADRDRAPVLVEEDGRVLHQANVILRHLAARPGSALLPESRRDQALTWVLVDRADHVLGDLTSRLQSEKDPEETKALEHRLDAELAVVEGILERGLYFFGERATIADLSVHAFLNRLEHGSGRRVPPERVRVCAWYERLRGALVAAPLLALAFSGSVAAAERPVATYSIVARDAATGEMGVAVQSHWFSVGSVVPWAEAGVGAVATQSFVEASYGPLGLERMRRGEAPAQALAALLAADPHPEVRQVAFVDTKGRTAAHTGPGCIPAAGHQTGDGYSVQANLMLSGEVPAAMAKAFEAARGPLAERLLAALEAAETVGGDIRGKQSAALLVVRAKASERPWTDRLVELRIEDAPRPLVELRRLLTLHRAYERMNRGDEAMAAAKLEEALREYASAEAMVPDNDEFVFWHAVALTGVDKLDEALPVFARAFRMNPSWMLLVPRLVQVKQLPSTKGLVERILAVGPKP